MKEIFLKNGFSKYSKFIDNKEIEQIRLIYDQILDNIEGTAHLRSDLSGKGDIGEEKSIFSSYKNMKKFLFVILSFFVSSYFFL